METPQTIGFFIAILIIGREDFDLDNNILWFKAYGMATRALVVLLFY